MTVCLITADLHLSDNPRDEYRHAFFKTIEREIKKNRVETLLILGDLAHEKDRHNAELTTRVFTHIRRLSRLCRVIILKGNHDYLLPSTPFFRSLGFLNNVIWINEPKEINVFDDDQLALFLPHTRDYESDWRDISIKDYDFIFTHVTCKGAVSDSGQELDGIPKLIFSKKQTVISGDVHVSQKVGAVEYVGAPYCIDFGDNPDKHMMLLDALGEKSYIPYRGPKKIMIDLDLEDELDLDGISEGDMIKVRIHLQSGQDLGAFRDCKEAIQRQLNGHAVLTAVQPVLAPGAAALGSKRRNRKSDRQVLEAYASSLGVRRAVIKTGLRLMKEN